MEGMSAAHNLIPGDIVQWFGRGRAMVVINSDSPWEGIENAVLCEMTVDGETHIGGFAAHQLEIVGAKPRQSHSEVYEWLTKAAISTATTLAVAGQRELAQGAVQLWSDAVGAAARDDDRLRLLQIIERARTA